MKMFRAFYNFFFGNDLPENQISEEEKPKIISFGNVLLDISVKLENTEILEKYNLILDSQGEIDLEILNKITQDIKNDRSITVSYGCGGSALNTIRILKKLNSKTETLFFGAVGNDDNAVLLEKILLNNGVNARLQKIPTESTGQCICFIFGDKNGLYANIGASSKLSIDHLSKSQSLFQTDPNDPQIFYIEGFFIPQRVEICRFIVETYVTDTKTLAINLNSSYIIRENQEAMEYLLSEATIIFGNRIEFNTLIELLNFESFEQLSQHFCKSSTKKKIIIVTSGSQDVLLFTNFDGSEMYSKNFSVPKVPENEIKDTTGAGDSFVAGFLNSFLQKQSLDESIKAGCVVAAKVVREIGCNLP